MADRTLALLVLAVATLLVTLSATTPASAAVASLDVSFDRGSPPPDPNLNALDIYAPDDVSTKDSRPVVVFVHGGGWSIGDKGNQIQDKVDLFTGAGYVFVSVNYRLSPNDSTTYDPSRIRFPDHPNDVGEAIGWLDRHIDEYGGDPTRLLLIGHSAGAHLVSLVSTYPGYVERHDVEPWQLIGTVSLDTGAFDVAKRIAELPASSQATFYNAFGTPEENEADDSWFRASPISWADPTDTRHLVVVQANSADRVADNRAMASALGQKSEGVFLAPYNHEGINDAVGGPDDTAGETTAIMDFFAKMVDESADVVASFAKRPEKRIRTDDRKAKVRFRFETSEPRSELTCWLETGEINVCKRMEAFNVEPGKHTLRFQAFSVHGRPGPVKKFKFSVVREDDRR